ncbi:MAG: hypothetical protein AB1847_21200 [bacterium]
MHMNSPSASVFKPVSKSNQTKPMTQSNPWSHFIVPFVLPFIFFSFLMGLGCGSHRSATKGNSEPAFKKANGPNILTIKKAHGPEWKKILSGDLSGQPDGTGGDTVLHSDHSTPDKENEPATRKTNKPEEVRLTEEAHVPVIETGGPEEAEKPGKILSATQPNRPNWIDTEASVKDGYLTLVGISGDCATGKLSIAEAMTDAQTKIVKYLGDLAKLEFKRISASSDLAGKIVDPNSAATSYREFLASDISKRAKESDFYGEKWSSPGGNIYRSFVLIKMPRAVIENSVKRFAVYNAAKAWQASKSATGKAAKKQAQKAAEFWKNVELGILPQ